MKKTMALCALLIGLGANAQHRPHQPVRGNDHSTELSTQQRASLQSKRLTLALGLDQQQQDQIAALLKTRLDERMEWKASRKSEAGSTERKDGASRYTALNSRLDREIAFQENIKGILSDSQFEQWRSLREDKMKERKNRSRGRRRHQARQG
ncbi:hypothetical protein [Robiginitalea sp.]|uniref:hypothetical protein n=1 Tax=Robiginitalea sp. TaxID=1902411 RepID=UPI003C50945B